MKIEAAVFNVRCLMLKLFIGPSYMEQLHHTGEVSVVSLGKAPDKAVLILTWNSQPHGLPCCHPPGAREQDVGPGTNSLFNTQVNQYKL